MAVFSKLLVYAPTQATHNPFWQFLPSFFAVSAEQHTHTGKQTHFSIFPLLHTKNPLETNQHQQKTTFRPGQQHLHRDLWLCLLWLCKKKK